MSRRTVTKQVTANFCDMPGCDNEAYGPCMLCGKHLCGDHGMAPGRVNLSLGSYMILICPDHEIKKQLPTLEDAERRLQAYYKDDPAPPREEFKGLTVI